MLPVRYIPARLLHHVSYKQITLPGVPWESGTVPGGIGPGRLSNVTVCFSYDGRRVLRRNTSLKIGILTIKGTHTISKKLR